MEDKDYDEIVKQNGNKNRKIIWKRAEGSRRTNKIDISHEKQQPPFKQIETIIN